MSTVEPEGGAEHRKASQAKQNVVARSVACEALVVAFTRVK